MPEHKILSTFFPQYYKVGREWWQGYQDSIEVEEETYRIDDFVRVYHGENDGKNYDIYDPQFSFGRIRRLRQGKVLVEYLYRPEEVASGRQFYHSAWELIGSDHWQIVSVESLGGVVEVNYWDEEEEVEPPGGRFWRQTYRTRTKALSNLKTHCICDRPSNPDKLNVICDNHDCRIQLHGSCLEKEFLDFDVGIKSVEILPGARVLGMKLFRMEDFLISSVSCPQCSTPILLEDTIPEGPKRDR
ncbi:hypothetical protein V8E51_001326 [Hyaloscypha variabilis]